MSNIIDKRDMCLHVHYRLCKLNPDADQKTALERLFGMSRMISNNLILKMKDYPDDLARSKPLTLYDIEAETLKFVNDAKEGIFTEELFTPGILKGILVTWLSRWEDFRNHRNSRPQFQDYQSNQSFYIFANEVEYTDNNFKIVPFPEVSLYLKSSKFPVSTRAPVHLLQRTMNGTDHEYSLYTLHEFVRYSPDKNQDEVLATWCARILNLEKDTRTVRRRYLGTYGGSRKIESSDTEYQLMLLRKITLDRLIRARESKITQYINDAASVQVAA